MTLLKNAAAGIGLKGFPFGHNATSGLRPGLGTLPLVGAASQSYEQMYRGQLWLNVVINKLARGIGRLPLKTYALGADGERLRQRDGWLADSLARPMRGKPPFAWKQAIVGNICVYGNAVVVKVRPGPGKPPTELWTSSFRYWEVVPGKSVPVEAYVFHGAAGQRLAFAPEDVLHFKWWGTGNDLVAFSPMEPLRRTLMIEDAAQRLTAASYDNGARPSGVLVTEQQLKPDTAKRLQEQTTSLHGGVDNAFKLAVLEGGLDWKPMSHSLGRAASRTWTTRRSKTSSTSCATRPSRPRLRWSRRWRRSDDLHLRPSARLAPRPRTRPARAALPLLGLPLRPLRPLRRGRGAASAPGLRRPEAVAPVSTTYQVLRFCEEYVDEWGHPPTVRDIQVGCHLASTSVVAYHLARLRAMGAIDSLPGAARTIRILERTL